MLLQAADLEKLARKIDRELLLDLVPWQREVVLLSLQRSRPSRPKGVPLIAAIRRDSVTTA